MAWAIEYTDDAKRDMKRLDRQVARRIADYMRSRIAVLDDPRTTGKALVGSKYAGQWRYRVGDYRVICNIQDDRIRVLVLKIGHRGEVYRRK